MKFIKNFILSIYYRITYSKGRSSYGWGWRKLRNEYIRENPYCEICGYYNLSNDVHHIIPRSVDPSKTLDKDNLMTLCRRYNCHLRFGHFGNYRSYYNPNVKDLEDTGKKMIKMESEFKEWNYLPHEDME